VSDVEERTDLHGEEMTGRTSFNCKKMKFLQKTEAEVLKVTQE
jgi:hypothetical protein